MLLSSICQAVAFALALVPSSALSLGNGQHVSILQDKRAPLQDIVTWDSHSLFVRGERVLFYSGEFHPFRLPVPGLWLDIFQKIRSAGYNGVSFYTNWAQLEGKQGDFRADGIFALEDFFNAAQAAGIYLLARPGPYINAEVSGGGYPGWLQRNPAISRTRDARYLNATTNYMNNILRIIAKAQITKGGPVILAQPENEYSQAVNVPDFPDPVYFQYVEDQFRRNGIVVPLISNDARPYGNFAPGPPRKQAAVDIYGHDGYPLGMFSSFIRVIDHTNSSQASIVAILTSGLQMRFPPIMASFTKTKARAHHIPLSSSKAAASILGEATVSMRVLLFSALSLSACSTRTTLASVSLFTINT
jgi:hypothetical protein